MTSVRTDVTGFGVKWLATPAIKEQRINKNYGDMTATVMIKRVVTRTIKMPCIA